MKKVAGFHPLDLGGFAGVEDVVGARRRKVGIMDVHTAGCATRGSDVEAVVEAVLRADPIDLAVPPMDVVDKWHRLEDEKGRDTDSWRSSSSWRSDGRKGIDGMAGVFVEIVVVLV